MSDLKTLKDFRTLRGVEKSERRHIFNIDELRQAAREWIKINLDDWDWGNIAICPKCKSKMVNDCEGWNSCSCGFFASDVELWIRYFFNLDGEDER